VTGRFPARLRCHRRGTRDDAQDAAAAQPFAEALAAVLLWQVALSVLVAALVLLLPRAAVPPDDAA
jgi:hypothetical protein